MTAKNFTTTTVGAAVASDEYSRTVGPDGPVVLHDVYLVEKIAQFNRERVPERVVHAKGGGAFGMLTVTEDVSAYTRAALFQPGAKTEMLARFSTVAGEIGSPDTWRDLRGLPRSLSVFTDTRVFPAMTSFSILFTSVLVRSFTRRVPRSGIICRLIRPVSVMIVWGFFGRPPFPMMRPAFMSFR